MKTSKFISKSWTLKLGLAFLAVLWLALIAGTYADSAETPNSAPDSSDDDYSFSWLDPEKKIYVLQNRRYLKTKRSLLSVTAGPSLSNPYRNTYGITGRVGYFFSEDFGLEGFFSGFLNSENNTFDALTIAAPNTLPVVREIRMQLGLIAQWVPWYAKLNVFNSVLYFDWYFGGGIGSLKAALDTRAAAAAAPVYVNENHLALYLNTGHLYHLNQHLVVRLDYLKAIYQAPVSGTSGTTAWFSNDLFSLGLGVKL